MSKKNPVESAQNFVPHDANTPQIDALPASFLSESADATRRFGETVGRRLRADDLLLLHGELGAGKTTFVQGVARALGLDTLISSPTYVLIIEHLGTEKSCVPLLHLDAYRLENLDDEALDDAGIFDFLARGDAIKIVEWPSCIAAVLPPPRFEIHLRHSEDAEQRRIEIIENTL